jgi:hypothetical protein
MFLEKLSPKPHEHSLDIFLFDGGVRTGKTAAAVARTIQFLLENPGASAVVGAENWPLLSRTAYDEWRRRFTIHEDWDHPLVLKRPTQQTKRLRLKNGSSVWFLHFSDFKILRGVEADIIHIEEASLLPSEESFNELIRRLSGKKGPIKQLILTTNPEEAHGWIYNKFSLRQYEADYEGEKVTIGELCNCNFCQECHNKKLGDFEWVNGRCPTCKIGRETKCPGRQEYFRVVRAASWENPNIPADFSANMAGSMSREYYELYGEGKVIELRKGKVYKGFSRKANVFNEDKQVEIDFSRDLNWSFDFNISYQCSVLSQDEGDIVVIKDEIVLPEAGPEQVALAFLHRYKDFDKHIYLYGDPAALNRKVGINDVSQYQTIYNILTNPKKFANLDIPPKKVTIMMKKVIGQTKIPVIGKVDATNALLNPLITAPRLMINARCLYLIHSLENLRWKETLGHTAIDTACDKAAAKSPDKKTMHLLSHITDALAYLIYKRFPVYEEGKPLPYMQVPGDTIIEAREEGIAEYSPIVPLEDIKIPTPKNESFLDFLEQYGYLGRDKEDESIGGFWW